jgi:hypothetical protein
LGDRVQCAIDYFLGEGEDEEFADVVGKKGVGAAIADAF